MDLILTGSIVLYKNGDAVKTTIRDFLETDLPVKLFLIDNSPTDRLKYTLESFIKDERVEYHFNNANPGFGAGHNLALKKAVQLSRYHLVLNPDVSFDKEVLTTLVAYMERNVNVGLVTPKIFYPNGELQYACKLLPTPADLIFRRFLPPIFSARRNEKFEMHDSGYNSEMEVPYLSGCFMFLRTSVIQKIGFFDERFFMYPEDIDLTRRIHMVFKTMYYPNVHIIHQHGKESYRSLKMLVIHVVNMIRYFNKWGWFFDKDREKINKRITEQYK